MEQHAQANVPPFSSYRVSPPLSSHLKHAYPVSHTVGQRLGAGPVPEKH